MDPFDFKPENNTTDELHALLREYILTCSTALEGEPVRTTRVRQYIGTGNTVEVSENEEVQYTGQIKVRDAFLDTDAGEALHAYLVDEHDFEPTTAYLSNVLQHAFQELDAVSTTNNPAGTGEQALQVDVNDDESLREVVDECVSILTADIHDQHQYTLRFALTGPIVENGTVEINDTHRLRGLDDGLLLGKERISDTSTSPGQGTNPKSWTGAAEIDMSAQHPFSETPEITGEFLAITLSVFSRSWIAVKNIYTVNQSFHTRMNVFPPHGKTDASLTGIEPQHGPRINALLQLLRPYCDASTSLQQSNPYFIKELFTPPINLALHHYGEALIRSNLSQSSTALTLFGLEALYKQYTEGKTSSRDVARYAAFTISQATENADPSKILTDITGAYEYRNGWAHGTRTGEITEELQNRMFDYLRYAIVLFAWIDTHTSLTKPHLDIETAFIDDAVRSEFTDSLDDLELTDYLRALPAGQ